MQTRTLPDADTSAVAYEGRGEVLTPTAGAPLPPPAVHSNFRNLPALPRAAEAIRFAVLRLEYWLSPSGSLRNFTRQIIRLTICLIAIAAFVAPLVTLLLQNLAAWSGKLAEAARNLAVIPAWLGTAMLGIIGLSFLKRLFFGR